MADEALIAHLLRRTGFGPTPGQVAALAEKGYAAALEAVLTARPLPVEVPKLTDDDKYTAMKRWWIARLADPNAGLHEKMVWFWHGHLTSSLDKADPMAMIRQYQLLSAHALGNARTLLQEITVDAAMLGWLDGAGSEVEAPNENYGRELMELFTLGRLSADGTPNYTEDDVRAASYALSGWVVDDKRDFKVGFHSESGPQNAVTLLGRSVKSAADVVDAVIAHDSFAPFISQKLHLYFHGVAAKPDRLADLARGFRSSGFDIAALVEAILRDPSFIEHRMTRPRFPVEWVTAADWALGREGNDRIEQAQWLLETLGQVPFTPPNVAGWPLSPRWLSAGAMMAKTAHAWNHANDTEVVSTGDPVAWVLERAGLYEISDTTRQALNEAARRIESKRERSSALHALALSSPEFALA
jgi:uncharacterized protein (DUF1800 family)